MSEPVLVQETVLRHLPDLALHDPGQHFVVLECEEHRFDVGVLDAHVDHTVVLLVLAGELVFLDFASGIVIRMRAEHQPVLGTSVHSLRIYIVARLRVPD